jgi:hypothetical protein
MIDPFEFKFYRLNMNLTIETEKLAVLTVRTPKNPKKNS